MRLLLISFFRSFRHALKYYILFAIAAIILINAYGAYKTYPVFAEFKQNMQAKEERFLEGTYLTMSIHKDDSYFVVVAQILKYVGSWGWRYSLQKGLLIHLFYSLIGIFIWSIIFLPSHYVCSKKQEDKK